MNIILINSPVSIKRFRSPLAFGQEPLNVSYVASALIKEGHNVIIKDYAVENYSNKLIKLCKSFSCELVGISCTTASFSSAKRIIRDIKNELDMTVVLGGKHASSVPKSSLLESNADFVVFGEGEETIVELIDSIKSNKSYSRINGLVYRAGSKIKINPPRYSTHDLDLIPFPPRHLFPLSKYRLYSTGKTYANILSSRGCPFSCTFCHNSKNNFYLKRVRNRSIPNIIAEIKEVIDVYGINYFQFIDDNFTNNPKRVLDFCDALKKNNLKIGFKVQGRVNSASLKMYCALKECGCDIISYGIESGDDRILGTVDKKATVAQAENAVKLAKEAGLKVRGNFILGFPNETIETITKTIDLSRRLKLYHSAFFILTPYPHSVLWDEAVKQGIVNESELDWDNFDQFHAYFTSKVLTKEVLQRYLNLARIYSATRLKQMVGDFLASNNKWFYFKNWMIIRLPRILKFLLKMIFLRKHREVS
jgi:anaerobic magnesium-protoporphyrin IX monomethyl ester cyclase